jgi:hypothetical protein
MSITRDYGEIVFECDSPNCLEFIETEAENWEVAKATFDRAGWMATNMRGTWEHYCYDCAKMGMW